MRTRYVALRLVWGVACVVRVVSLASAGASVVACSRSGPTPQAQAREAPDTAVRTTSADLVDDGGFVSAAAELVTVDAGANGRGPRPLASSMPAAKAIDVPAGTFASGSTPGDDGRDPGVEPALAPVTLGAFSIDALPYPDDPSATPLLVSSPGEAARACAERGARLCTELEWERACKGPNGDPFATGASWNADCDGAPSRCASGFGVRAMGFLAEWTDSRFEGDARETPVLRGGPASRHRCAARVAPKGRRSGRPATAMTIDAAFRCCHGDRNAATVPGIKPKPAFRDAEMSAADLAKVLDETPELTRISDDVRLFTEEDVKTILSRSSASADGISFSTAPILWSPQPGVELLVATGRSKRTGFVVALWVMPDGANATRYRFASSFLLLRDPSPVALAFEPSRRKELRWATCWGCAGEQGAVSLRDDGRVVIVQY